MKRYSGGFNSKNKLVKVKKKILCLDFTLNLNFFLFLRFVLYILHDFVNILVGLSPFFKSSHMKICSILPTTSTSEVTRSFQFNGKTAK